MSNKAIAVSLYRVSSDSFYLDTIVDCPEGYNFDQFIIQIDELVAGKFITRKYDLTTACFPESSNGTTHFNFRIPLEVFQPDMGNIPNPAIYTADLQATNTEDDTTLTTRMITSDVNFAYRCMLDDILNPTDRCNTLSDDAIRKYLLLYGHQAAMSVEDFETAKAYYKLIATCFDPCGADYRNGNRGCPTCGSGRPPQPCNCGRR